MAQEKETKYLVNALSSLICLICIAFAPNIDYILSLNHILIKTIIAFVVVIFLLSFAIYQKIHQDLVFKFDAVKTNLLAIKHIQKALALGFINYPIFRSI